MTWPPPYFATGQNVLGVVLLARVHRCSSDGLVRSHTFKYSVCSKDVSYAYWSRWVFHRNAVGIGRATLCVSLLLGAIRRGSCSVFDAFVPLRFASAQDCPGFARLTVGALPVGTGQRWDTPREGNVDLPVVVEKYGNKRSPQRTDFSAVKQDCCSFFMWYELFLSTCR